MTNEPTLLLHGFGPAFGLPEASPYVTKTEVHLKMLGLPYRKVVKGFAGAPKGKLPYIDDGGTLVADSTFIRAHLERTHGVDLDEGLDARARAEAWAIERLLEDHLGFAMSYFRWCVPESFDKGPAHFFDGAPEPVRAKLREDAQARVKAVQHGQGMGRHSVAEIAELGGRSLAAVSTLLGDRPFLMGERLSGADAIAFGMLAGVMTPFFDTELQREAASHANLVAYVERMMARFFPEHRADAAA